MSDHEFEKQVRRKMDELKFRPSDDVWKGIQASLPERSRRRGIIWLPVLLVLLGTGGYFLYNADLSSGSLAVSSKTTIADKTNADDNNTTRSNDQQPIDQLSRDNNNKSQLKAEAPGEAESPEPVNAPKADRVSTVPPFSNPKGQIATQDNRYKPAAASVSGKKNYIASSKSKPGDNKVSDTNRAESESVTGDQKQQSDINTDQTADQKSTDNNISTSNDVAAVADSSFLKVDSALVEAAAPINTSGKKNKPRRKWELGLNVSGGISKLQESKLGSLFHATNLADAMPVDRLASNNFVFAPNITGIPVPTASVVKPGVSFSIGGYVKTSLSKRFSVSAGLQYSQYNNIIYVGNRVDSSRLVNSGAQVANVSRYYRPDHQSRFSNRYHFIELPVQLHTQLNKSLTTPILWNLGVSISQMFASDALLFDSGTGVYYKDDSQYKNTQVALSTGFSAGILSRSKMPLWIGPSVKYHASPLFNNHFAGKKHLASVSLDLQLQLNKK